MIEQFVRIRRDRRRVEEDMDAKAILALRWGPDKIVRIEWTANGSSYVRDFAHGVLAKLAPDRSAIVLLEEVGDADIEDSELSVVNPDGSTRFQIANTQLINGAVLTGNFAWFEPARKDPEHAIGVVFQVRSATASDQYQLDLDLDTGQLAEARISR